MHASGPALRFSHPATVCVTGAECLVTLDGVPVPMWEPVDVPAGGLLDVGTAETLGLRTYVLFAGAWNVPHYLGSAATFTLGRFGGHGGRELHTGDVLRSNTAAAAAERVRSRWNCVPLSPRNGSWPSPRARTAPRSSSPAPIWTPCSGRPNRVHFNSARTGVRLEGPKPEWAARTAVRPACTVQHP
jgi:urea carboxylase